MRRFMSVLCLLALFCSPAPAAEVLPDLDVGTLEDEGGAMLCYRGDEGFLLEFPAGWSNLRIAAGDLGLCALLAPGGSGLHDAPVLIYPRLEELKRRGDFVDVFIERTLNNFRVAPGGGDVRERHGGTVTSDSGLLFELRYLDFGPSPNNFELLALHVGKDSMLLLVLTSMRQEELERHKEIFVKMLKGIVPFAVSSPKNPPPGGFSPPRALRP